MPKKNDNTVKGGEKPQPQGEQTLTRAAPKGEQTLTRRISQSQQTLTRGVSQGQQTLTRGGAQGAQTLTRGGVSQGAQTLTQDEQARKPGLTMTRTFGGGGLTLIEKPAWQPGDLIDGKYQVIESIGQGGMGIVYKVHHHEWKIDLAVKVPLVDLVADAVSKARFVREAQIWVDLGLHPNIVQCWYVRELGGIPRVFMDFLGGGSLKDWIVRENVKPGEWDKILDLTIQACDGLAYAYEQGMTAHRDVKPGNLLLTEEGQLRVTDFGIVKHGTTEDIQDTTSKTTRHDKPSAGTVLTDAEVGTPEYGAPEQWEQRQNIDQRADIYALGIVLFEMCCGRRPFDDGEHTEPVYVLIGRHLSTPAPNPRSFNRDIPDSLAELILKCLEKDPEKRPESMHTLRDILAHLYREIVEKAYRRPVPKAGELRSDSLNNRAVSFLDLGKKQEAFEIWAQALKLDAYHSESAYNKALVQWVDGLITDDEVVRRLDEIKHTHTSSRINYYLGLIHLERAAADQAEEELADAMKYPDLATSGDTWRTLGDARMAQEKFAEAAEAYEKTLELVPEDDGLQTRQSLALQGTRQYEGHIIFPWRRSSGALSDGHTQSVTTVAMTHDGVFALSGGQDGLMQLWDVKEQKILKTYERYGVEIMAVTITPDGKFFVSGDEDSTLCLWDIDTSEYLRFFEGHKRAITSLAITANGRFIISGSHDKTLRMWELATGKKVRRFRGHTGVVTSLAVSLGGNFIISGSQDSTLRMWDPRKGAKCLKVFEGHQGGVTAISLAVDGRVVVSGSEDSTLKMWDLESGECRHTLKGHSEKVTAVAVTPDERFILSGSADRAVRLWDFATGKCLRTFKEHTDGITSIAVAANATLAVTGSDDKTVRVWNLDSEVQPYESPLQVCLQQNLEDIQASTVHFRKRMHWSKTAWKAGKTIAAYKYLKQARSVSGYERTPESLALNAVISQFLPRKKLDGEWRLWTFAEHSERVTAVAATPDGRRVVSGSQDKTLRLWDLTTGKCLLVFQGHSGAVTSVAVTPDGRFVLSGSEDNTLRLWAITSGTCLRTYEGHTSGVLAVTLTPHGQFIVSSSHDRTIRIWNPATTECLQIFKGHNKEITAVAVAPNREFVASCSEDRTVRWWERQTGKRLLTLSGHKNTVTAVKVDPSGRYLLSGSKDMTLKLWEIAAGKCVRTFEAHQGYVSSLDITPDSRFVISGSKDRTLRLWNIKTGKCTRVFEGHALGVNTVTFTRDGRYLISGSDDKSLKVWELDWELDTSKRVAEETQESAKTGGLVNRFTSFFQTGKKR